jgi:hypothetical protein
MVLELNYMPEFGTTAFKIDFDGVSNHFTIFLRTTPQELIALLEEQIANLKQEHITETNTDSDESTELKTLAEKFNASPIGLVVNNILNK